MGYEETVDRIIFYSTKTLLLVQWIEKPSSVAFADLLALNSGDSVGEKKRSALQHLPVFWGRSFRYKIID